MLAGLGAHGANFSVIAGYTPAGAGQRNKLLKRLQGCHLVCYNTVVFGRRGVSFLHRGLWPFSQIKQVRNMALLANTLIFLLIKINSLYGIGSARIFNLGFAVCMCTDALVMPTGASLMFLIFQIKKCWITG